MERELQGYAEADFVAIGPCFVERAFPERGFPEEKLLLNPYRVDLEHFRPVPKQDALFACVAIGESARERVHAGLSWQDYGNRAVRSYQRILA